MCYKFIFILLLSTPFLSVIGYRIEKIFINWSVESVIMFHFILGDRIRFFVYVDTRFTFFEILMTTIQQRTLAFSWLQIFLFLVEKNFFAFIIFENVDLSSDISTDEIYVAMNIFSELLIAMFLNEYSRFGSNSVSCGWLCSLYWNAEWLLSFVLILAGHLRTMW